MLFLPAVVGEQPGDRLIPLDFRPIDGGEGADRPTVPDARRRDRLEEADELTIVEGEPRVLPSFDGLTEGVPLRRSTAGGIDELRCGRSTLR